MSTEQKESAPLSGIVQAVNETELDIAFSGPALYANKFYITTSSVGARIAFTEQMEGRLPAFRNAVILQLADAIALSKLLQELIKEVQLESSNSSQPNNG